jgi:uncharacterized protein YndB with AHSA1/START domain
MLIYAPIETIWDLLSDVGSWPSWQPSISRVKAPRPLVVGSVFLWQKGGMDCTSTVEEIEAPTRIVWTGPTQGLNSTHVWTLTQMEDGVLVKTEESWEGKPPKDQVAKMQKALDTSLRDWLQNLKQIAERRRL